MPSLSEPIEDALNRQINQEVTGAYSYLAMAAYFETKHLDGFASWMHAQRTEELAHAMRLFKYLLDRGGEIELEAVAKPAREFKSFRDVFALALALEQANTKGIHEIYAMAVKENDYATQSHLQWFVDEQVEEEEAVEHVLGLFDIAGDDKSALLELNRQLAERGTEEPASE